MDMEWRKVEVRLTESEYVSKTEIATVGFDYGSSWIVGEDGTLAIRYGEDGSKPIATFAAGEWRYIRQVNKEH